MNIISVGTHREIVEKHPGTCPFCQKEILVQELIGRESAEFIEVVFQCPGYDCKRLFIGYYGKNKYFLESESPYHPFLKVSQGNLSKKAFNEIIENISPSFIEIYNQAFYAEQHNLLEICGVGYRKSLEFLIKDYTIYLNPDNAERIKKTALAQVISEFVTNANIKGVASRAAWLGNDETHYVRRWEALDVQHLKKLIDLSVHWIESEELTKSFINDMPETGPK